MPGYRVNGMDVLEVRQLCDEVVKLVRGGSGPALIEARCYRYQGHSMTDPGRYRARAEEDLWRKRDPIPRFIENIRTHQGQLTEEEWQQMDDEVLAATERSVEYAKASPFPAPEAALEDVFSD